VPWRGIIFWRVLRLKKRFSVRCRVRNLTIARNYLGRKGQNSPKHEKRLCHEETKKPRGGLASTGMGGGKKET